MLINNTIESSRKPGIPGPHRPDLKWFKDALDGKSDVGHVHKKKDIEDFEHNHDGRYYRKDEHELQLLLSGNGTPNFNQGINGDYYVDELNGDLYKKSGDAWNLIIHLEGKQGAPGPQGNPGVPGPQGNPGKEGYTPVRGTDYWTPEDEEIIRQSIVSEVQLGLSNKVDKVAGKGLSTEDFTTLLKQKLEELQNYDDRDIRELLEKALYNVTIDVKTGILTFHTIDESTFTVDLPLELIVSDGYLNKDTNTIVLVLANGNTIDIPVENLIKDFYSKSEVDQKIADLAEEVAEDFEAVAEDFNKVDEELAKAQAQIDALKAENEAQQKELDVLYNDLVPGEASGETAVVTDGVTGSKVEIDGDGNTYQEVIEAEEGTTVTGDSIHVTDVNTAKESSLLPNGTISQDTRVGYNQLGFEDGSETLNSVTCTRTNGKIILNGTATAVTKFFIPLIKAFEVPTNNSITLQVFNPIAFTGTEGYLRLRFAQEDNTEKGLLNVGAVNSTYTAVLNYTEDTILTQLLLRIESGVTLSNFELNPQAMLGTDKTKPYEQYGVMPSIDFPSKVKGVGSEEEINLANIQVVANKSNIDVIETNLNYIIVEQTSANKLSNFHLNAMELKAGVTYTVKRKFEVLSDYSDTDTGNVEIYLGSKWKKVILYPNKNEGTFTVDEDGTYYLMFKLAQNSVSTATIPIKIKFYDVMVCEGTNKSYTPYGYCRYENAVENKNLYSIDKILSKGGSAVDVTYEENKIIQQDTGAWGNAWQIFKTPQKNSNISVSADFLDTVIASNKAITIYGLKEVGLSNWVSLKYSSKDVALNTKTRIEVTTNIGDYEYIGIRYWNNYSATALTSASNCIVDNIQMEIGQPTDYTPHQEQLLPIDIPTGTVLYTGKPYKIDGKWYRKEKYLKRQLTSSLAWALSNSGAWYYVNLDWLGYARPNDSFIKSTHFKKGAWGTSNTTQKDIICLGNSSSGVVGISVASFDSIDSLKEFLDNNEVYIVGQLATPTVEEITDETLIAQLEALNNAELYEGVTNINSYALSENVANMPLELHYNFITPAPSIDRDSEVEITESPNMFNSAYFKEETSNGITLTQNEDGTVTLNGTSTGNTMFRILRTGQTLLGTGNEKLTIFPLEGTLSSGDLKFIAQDTNYAELRYAQIGTARLNQKLKPNVNYNIFALTFTTGAVCNNLKIGLVIGSDISHFIPYGHIGLLQQNKNILPNELETQTSKGITATVFEDGSINFKGTPTATVSFEIMNKRKNFLKLNTKYVLSSKNDIPENAYFRIGDGNDTSLYYHVNVKDNNPNKVGFTYNGKFTSDTIRAYVFFGSYSVGVAFDFTIYPMLEENNAATDYVKHKENLIPIDLQGNTLAKVGDIKDLLNIGLDGSVSIEKKIDEHIITGNESGWYKSNTILIDRFGCAAKNINENFDIQPKIISLCNYFKYKYDARLVGYFFTLLETTTGKSILYFDFSEYNITTLNDFKAFLKEKYNNGKPLKVMYQKEKPETINLPSIKPIELFEGTNNFELITSLPTTLTAHYKVSSKKQLIENNERITALEATVNTLLGGN